MKIIIWTVLVGVIAAVAVGRFVRGRSMRLEQERIAALIKPPRYVFKGHDESLQEQADRRKVEAEDMRRRAALYAGGQWKSDVRRFRKEA